MLYPPSNGSNSQYAKLATVQARRRRACSVANCGFGAPSGRAKPAIGFKMRIAVLTAAFSWYKSAADWRADDELALPPMSNWRARWARQSAIGFTMRGVALTNRLGLLLDLRKRD
jgi:hypothetical protein